MNAYDFVHLALFALGKEIKGKTKLQKTIYFLGVLTDTLKDLGYRPHFYGPYSAEVAGAIDRLRSLGFVDQSVAGAGALDQQGFEVARYDFCLNEQGKRIAKTKSERNPDLWKRIQSAVKCLGKAKDQDYMKLSIAAKTYYMLGEKAGIPASVSELTALATKFGWAVTNDQVSEAFQFLKAAGLIEVVE
jgi:uncharacterized protein YwgA